MAERGPATCMPGLRRLARRKPDIISALVVGFDLLLSMPLGNDLVFVHH